MLNLDTHILIHALGGHLRPREKKLLSARTWTISAIGLWELAKLVEATIGRIEECAEILFGDIGYALHRAKMLAEMVISVIASSEMLRQVGVDEGRLDLAEAFIRRHMLETEAMARRIEENHEGRLERDARILARYAP